MRSRLPARRIVLVLAASSILAAVWLPPLQAALAGPFSLHMTRHMSLVAVAAPLLALAIAGQRFDPVCRWPWLFPPVPVAMVELVVVWAWHAPRLHHLAHRSVGWLVLEQASFLVSGLWLWLSALGGGGRQRDGRIGAGLLSLLLTSMHMTLLGALLALPSRLLYAHPHARHSLALLQDQQLGGAIMLVVGGLSYLVGALALAAVLLRAHGSAAPLPERRAPR